MIRHERLADLAESLTDFQSKVIDIQNRMNCAATIGGWSAPKLKRNALKAIDKLKAIKLLLDVTVGFTNFYPHPSNKIPTTTIHALHHVFVKLNLLAHDLNGLNQTAVSGPVKTCLH